MVSRRPASRTSTTRPPPPHANALLAALPAKDYERISQKLEPFPLTLKRVLYKPGERIEHVYFPGGGFCSVLAVLEDGGMVEIATIGREGMVGNLSAFGEEIAPTLTMVQGETDTCYRMTANAFRQEMENRGRLAELVVRYTQALFGCVAQSTACNAVHTVEQRLARWLLMARDRMGRDQYPLTQEFVAMMLGATRPTVSVVAGALQKAGLITYHRGLVTIRNRRKLETASCECYRAATELMKSVTDGARPPRKG